MMNNSSLILSLGTLSGQGLRRALLYGCEEASASWRENMVRLLSPGPFGSLPRRDPRQLPGNHCLPLVYRQAPEVSEEAGVRGPQIRDYQLAQLEAALLVADEPLPARKLAQAVGLSDASSVRRLVRKLQNFYEKDGSAFGIEELAGGFQLLTRPQFHRWLNTLRRDLLNRSAGARLGYRLEDLRLTPPARETLAIIAYRQPIMRADIEAIRGVHCAETLRLLMEKGLVKIAGRHDSLGRPVLYGTTKKFLQVFGLKSLKDLPRAEEMKGKDTKSQSSKESEPQPPGSDAAETPPDDPGSE